MIDRFSVESKTVIRCLLLALLTSKRISCIVISTSNRSKIAPLLFVCFFAEDGSPHDIVCPVPVLVIAVLVSQHEIFSFFPHSFRPK